MKIFLVLLLFWNGIVENSAQNLKCEDKGCYEVVKVFAELLEKKINETDILLAKAENELNEITFGNDVDFKQKIKEVDEKLANLLSEFNVGVDGGDKTLFELINSVSEDVKNIENLSGEIDNELEAASKNNHALDENLDDTQEIIQEIQNEINRLLNATAVEGPEALQDAFDRSEKFNTNSGQLKDILDEAKLILKDYEENLKNAKVLTEKAIEKFAKVSQQVNETLETQQEVEGKFSGVGDLKKSESELKNLQKLSGEALEEANRVFDDAFDLLNEVTKFELVAKLDGINEKIEKLNNYSGETDKTLKEFADENAKFLDEMEKTIETAEKAEKRAFKLKDEIEILLETIKSIHEDALKSIADVEAVIDNGTKIYKILEDFTLNVEKSRENARIAFEKLPEIIKKIADTLTIVEKLEEKMDEKTKIALEKKEKFTKAKELTDEVLAENENVKKRLEQFEKDFENQPEEVLANDKEQTRISDEIEKLDKVAEEDSKLAETTKEKVETANSEMLKTDEEVEKVLKKVQQLIEDLAKVKEIGEETLDDFDIHLNEAENLLTESNLNENLRLLRAERHEQKQLIDQYELEIAFLEYQISVIKGNAESLENRCFKRTRLEP